MFIIDCLCEHNPFEGAPVFHFEFIEFYTTENPLTFLSLMQNATRIRVSEPTVNLTRLIFHSPSCGSNESRLVARIEGSLLELACMCFNAVFDFFRKARVEKSTVEVPLGKACWHRYAARSSEKASSSARKE